MVAVISFDDFGGGMLIYMVVEYTTMVVPYSCHD